MASIDEHGQAIGNYTVSGMTVPLAIPRQEKSLGRGWQADSRGF